MLYNKSFSDCTKKIGQILLSIMFATIWLNSMKYYNVIGYLVLPSIATMFFAMSLLGQKIKKDCLTVLFLLVFAELFMSSIVPFFHNYELHYGQVFSYFLMLGLCFVLHQQNFTFDEMKKLWVAFVIGGLIIALSIILLRTRYFENDATRLTIRTSTGDLADPNFIGSILGTVLSVTLFLFSKERKKWYLISILCFGFAVFLTGSRGALVYCLITLIGFSIEFILTLKKTSINIFILIVGFFFIFPPVVCFLYFKYYESFSRLFLNLLAYTSDASNMERLSYWKNGLTVFFENPLLGQGIVREEFMFKKLLGISMQTAHNTWITLANQLGILGLTIYLSPLLYALYRFIQKKQITLVAMVIGFIVNVAIISAPISFVFWLPYIAFILLIDYC